MTNGKQYLFMFLSYLTIFCINYLIFNKLKITIIWEHLFILSIFPTYVLKAIYDIVFRTGNKQMYIYSEKTNQKLRYLAFFIIFCFTTYLFYGYISSRSPLKL